MSLRSLLRASPLGPIVRSLKRRYFPHPLSKNDTYDLDTIAVIQRVVRRDSSCIDVGAHKGKILKHIVGCAPQGRHHAFEPLPDCANILRQRYPMVTVHHAAAGHEARRATFVHVENAPAYSGLRRRIYDHPDPVLKEITVQVVRIDDVVSDPIALIKLDVEGGEYDALRGALETVRRSQPIVIFEAGIKSSGQYGVTPDAMWDLFQSVGYSVSTQRRWLDGAPAYEAADFRRAWLGGLEYYFLASPRSRIRE